MKKITKKQGGFTLIEVVLVLAIGALIILMALLAFGGASRARRDTSRANAAGTFVAALEQYASNNSGSYPPQDLTGITLTKAMNDPATGNAPVGSASIAGGTTITYTPGVKCSTTTPPTLVGGAGTGSYAVTYKQESGTLVCKDNQN